MVEIYANVREQHHQPSVVYNNFYGTFLITNAYPHD